MGRRASERRAAERTGGRAGRQTGRCGAGGGQTDERADGRTYKLTDGRKREWKEGREIG